MDTTQIVILVALVVAVAVVGMAYGYRRRGDAIHRRGREPAHPTDSAGYETESRASGGLREDTGSVGHPQEQRSGGRLGGTPQKGGEPPHPGGGGTSDISQR